MRKDFRLPDEPDFPEEENPHSSIPPVLPGRIGSSIPRAGEDKNASEPGKGVHDKTVTERTDDDFPENPVLRREKPPAGHPRAESDGLPGDKTDDAGKAIPRSLAYTAGDRRKPRNGQNPGFGGIRPVTAENALPEAALVRFSARRDGFFTRAARAVHGIRFVILILLILYILANLLLYGDSVSYENARLLLYDFQNAAQTVSADAVSTIRIGSDTSRRYDIFRGEFCVAGQSGLALYRSNGRQILSDTHYLYRPSLTGGDRYRILYDRGYSNYYVYNSYALVFEGETEYPISLMSCSDEGSYLIQTRTREYRSAVEIYSAKFKLRSQIRTQSLVMTSALSPDGSHAVTAAVEAEGSSYMTILTGYTAANAEKVYQVSLPDTFPLSVSFYGDAVILVGSDAIYIIGTDGEIAGKYEYGDADLTKFECAGGITALILTDGSSLAERLVLLDGEGKVLHQATLTGTVTDLDFSDQFLYLLGESGVDRVSLADGGMTFVSCDWGATCILAYSDSISAVVYADTIKCIRFE